MGRKAQVKRSAEEKWEIVQEGLRSGNISETCRKHGVAANLWYRWKDEAEQGAKAALGGRSVAGGKPFGIVYWASMMSLGMFFPLGETPYGAIPFYLVIGWCASPLLLAQESSGCRSVVHRSASVVGMNPGDATAIAS